MNNYFFVEYGKTLPASWPLPTLIAYIIAN